MINYELGAYYRDGEGRIIQLLRIFDYKNDWMLHKYNCLMIREGRYPSLNKNPVWAYSPSAMAKCKKLSNAEIVAVTL